jgi:DNA repair protein RadC
VRSAKLSNANPYEYGAKRYMADADAFYIYYDSKLQGDKLFTVVSHEIGHIVEQEVFSKSSEQTKKAVKEDYEKWFASLTGKTVEEVAKETRDITLADLIEGNTRKFDSSKDRYISSFSEYFADNVSKWARTSEKPKSAVDKYFAGIVELFKKLHDYVSEKGLYSKSLFEWLDGMYETETAPQAEKKYAKSKEEGGELQVNETPNGVPYLSQSGGAEYEVPNGLQWEGNKLGGNFLDVIGVWNETNYINFNGGAYVKDASDVAEIMSLLENKSVEHSFAVHVDENEVPHIQFLNIGTTSAAHFNAQAVLAGVKKFNSKKVYLVHNHPSGNLKLSEQDKKVTQNAQKLLEPLGVLVNHVVLNTYKKEYSVYENFDGMYLTTEGIPRKKDGGEEKLTTHIFNEQKVLSVPQKVVKSSQDAATFIQQIRLTALPKNAVLLLSQSNEIIGNYVFPDSINYKELTDIISESGIVQGLIFYGNQNNIAEISEIKERLSNANIRVLDLLIVSSDSSSIVGYYKSASDQGLLNDVQEKYGTNSVPSLSAEFTSNQESSASEEFDGTKKPSKIKTKSFDNKYGKGAFERMQNITQNFEDIMDGLSEKIKQDCL